MTAKKHPTSEVAQHKRFIEAARALECDEDKERFEEKLGRIARAKPVNTPRSTKEKKP